MNSYDIETYVDHNFNHKPYCVVYKINKTFNSFYYTPGKDVIEMSLESIFNLRNGFRKTTIYVHNLDFDGLLILNFLYKSSKYEFKVFMRSLKIYSLRIHFKGCEVEFKCSFKILPSPLKKIAEGFDLPPKLPFPYKFSSLENIFYRGAVPDVVFFNSEKDRSDCVDRTPLFDFKEYSITYCKRDVEITSLFLKKLKTLLSGFNINIESVSSAPSLSLKIFIQNFNRSRVRFSPNKTLDNVIRPSYYGGRCEVFGNPKEGERVFHFDFSGMYGQCMKEKFCYGNYKINTGVNFIEKPGFYWIKFRSNSEYPVLPHHSRINKKLMFANGVFKGCFWHEEILKFIEHGGEVLQIMYHIEFEKYDYIFEEFVDFFEKIRQIGPEHKTFGKLMINSLYGRLGMEQIETSSFFINREKFDKLESKINIKKKIYVEDLVFIEAFIDHKLEKYFKIKKEKIKSNIALASAITAKGRVKLYNAYEDVWKNGGRLLYSDTDSVFAAFNRDVSGEKHGEVFWDPSKKDTIIEKGVFVNPKTYALIYQNGEEIVKMKGYNQKSLNFATVKDKFYKSSPISIENYRLLSKSNLNLEEILIKKTFDLENYSKRKFTSDKKETTPYKFEDNTYI